MRGLLILSILAALSAGGYRALDYSGCPEVRLVVPTGGPAVRAVYATGVVEPRSWAAVVPLEGGQIVAILADENQPVAKGDPLAALDGARVRRSHLTLRAPAPGLILRRDGEIGEVVESRQPVSWDGAPRPLLIEAEVDEEDIPQVRSGPVPVNLVRDVDVAFEAREFCTITGPSGSGKSSLLYLLGLPDVPTEGRIAVDGVDTGDLSADGLADLRLARLGLVFQFHFLLEEFSVADNVALPMRKVGRLARPEARDRTLALLDGLGLAVKVDCGRANSPAASDSGPRWLGRWPTIPRSSWPTSQRGTSTPATLGWCSTSSKAWSASGAAR